MKKYVKLSQYAEFYSIHYKTAWRHYRAGKIKGFQDELTKTIYVENPEQEEIKGTNNRAILYARVSSSTNKASLDGQIERMRSYAAAKGYVVVKETKEIASGLNEERKGLNNILDLDDYDVLIVEHKDRLTRFGFNFIEKLIESKGKILDVINHQENKDHELVDDFVSIVTSFCGRIYGRKRKKKTEEIITAIKHN